MKNRQRITCILMSVIIALVCTINTPQIVSADTKTYQDKVDMSLDKEIDQYVAVLDRFLPFFEGEKSVVTCPTELAKEFIPVGSWCTEVCVCEDGVIIDYRINGMRYVSTYVTDGTVQKTARSMEGDIIYSIDSKNRTVDSFDNNDLERDELSVNNQAGNSYGEVQNVEAAAATRTIYAVPYTSDPAMIPYTAKVVWQGTTLVRTLTGTGYDNWPRFKVYESMNEYDEVVKSTSLFGVATTIAQIALSFVSSPSSVISWLDIGGIAYSITSGLQEACRIVRQNSFTYWGGKEFGIYDATQWNTYVETYSSWEEGEISLSWQYNSSTGYRDPSWGHTAPSSALSESNYDALVTGRDRYEYWIGEDGYWRWGVGNGFGI